MDRVIFIDDDRRELEEFRGLIEGVYTCTLVHWPREREQLFSSPAPDLLVSDLYLPSADGDLQPTTQQREQGASMANQIAGSFQGLYATGSQGMESIETCKARLQATTRLITRAHEELLRLQWEALGQSPANGIALLQEVINRFRGVPFVFYSRKINAEDVINTLKAGAVDAIRKGVAREEVLARLRDAQRFHGPTRFLTS